MLEQYHKANLKDIHESHQPMFVESQCLFETKQYV